MDQSKKIIYKVDIGNGASVETTGVPPELLDFEFYLKFQEGSLNSDNSTREYPEIILHQVIVRTDIKSVCDIDVYFKYHGELLPSFCANEMEFNSGRIGFRRTNPYRGYPLDVVIGNPFSIKSSWEDNLKDSVTNSPYNRLILGSDKVEIKIDPYFSLYELLVDNYFPKFGVYPKGIQSENKDAVRLVFDGSIYKNLSKTYEIIEVKEDK